MPRTKIDFHQSRQAAAEALSSLRGIGLNSGDVGSAWLADTAADGTSNDAPTTATSRVIRVSDVGEVRFSGWLAEVALEALDDQQAAPLSAIFDDLTLEPAELVRLRDTLAAGGGIVGVRARDNFSPEPD